MASKSASSNSKLKFDSTKDIESKVETRLKRRYGSGIFVDNYAEMDGGFSLILGNNVPKDVSDCRAKDRGLKFVSYKPIFKLSAVEVPGGYVIELPDRSEIQEGFVDRRQAIARNLDSRMAKTIYEELIEFTPVENQLGAIKKILRVVRKHQPVPREEIIEMRGRDGVDQTQRYLRVLADAGFIIIEEGMVFAGPELAAHDVLDIRSKEFSKVVLGQVVQKAFHMLKDELNLTLLAHYPKYAGAYYFSALQRDEPNLRLDIDAVTRDLKTIYGDKDAHEFDVEMKLDDLADVDVIKREDGYYKSNPSVYSELVAQTPV